MKTFVHLPPLQFIPERIRLLEPKQYGLVGYSKPLILILNSPLTPPNDCATRYKSAKKFVEDRGYTAVNKKEIVYSLNVDDFSSSTFPLVKPQYQGSHKSITIWLEAHGAPGWLFSPGKPNSFTDYPTNEGEKSGLINFSRYLSILEEKIRIKIDSIVLSGCFTGTELVNQSGNSYLNSPARLLSILMPEKKILGFLGINTNAKISNLLKANGTALISTHELVLSNDSFLEFCHTNLVEGSILFQNGQAIEYGSPSFFCNNDFMELFVLKHCNISADSPACFRILPAREEIAKRREQDLFPKEPCFADYQLDFFKSLEGTLKERRSMKLV